MRTRIRPIAAVVVALAALTVGLTAGAGAAEAAGTVSWKLEAVTMPTVFSPSDAFPCQSELEKCDSYQLVALNTGDGSSEGEITLEDKLPIGIHLLRAPRSGGFGNPEEAFFEWSCSVSEQAGRSIVLCAFPESIPAGQYTPFLELKVSSPTPGTTESLVNEVRVKGGGAASPAMTTQTTRVSGESRFEVSEFGFEPTAVDGTAEQLAGGHPWQLTTSFGVPSVLAPPGNKNVHVDQNNYAAVENIKNVAVELPLGFFGDPQATEKCTQIELKAERCPAGSRIGVYSANAAFFEFGESSFTGDASNPECCSAVYNMVSEPGFPAEFGFTFAKQVIYLYASVVRTPTGYRVRVAVPGIPGLLETTNSALTLFGEPGALNGSGSTAAFLSNPADCSSEASAARIELDSWSNPGRPVSREAQAYPSVTGCESLQFHPSLSLGPSPGGSGAEEEGTSQADEPSAYSFDLAVPQTSSFSEPATPPLKDATVTLPAGVSVDPSAASGLAGCQETGPEGINIGSGDIGAGGQDLGDPEATELGAGHAGPGENQSPYDDGFYHVAPGHCPAASSLGTVEVTTPLLSNPLRGHIYLAQPKCGGGGQPPCTEASATNGELFGGYVEVAGEGVIVKIPGTISANPATGQLTGHFEENPQFPFEDLKAHFHGGPRAPVANPQACGSFATSSLLTSWAGQVAAVAGEPFSITGCSATMPFSPSFNAGTTNPQAGAFSPFTLTLSRNDREQDLAGVTVTLPPGLLGKIAGTPLCGEAQANAGSCPQASEVGEVTATAGPGSEPYVVTGGRVYLTGPTPPEGPNQSGGPFGLSIVVPAKAGPFNLGDVVVRASIRIDPSTAQVTVVSDPLPQIKDGVPFRLRTVNVNVNRTGFTFNPTNCNQFAVNATITAAQGATASVSSPFAVTSCQGLPFNPVLSASTLGHTSKRNGASLHVHVSSAGIGQANIHKVELAIPAILPSRLTTLQKACSEAQFNANPAGCPSASDIATAAVHTPLLNSPLLGPVYFVSRGGAAFPDTEIILQGEGVELTLDGHTDIKKGVTYSRFETVPDAPFTSFDFNAPEGPYSIFGANGNLCQTEVRMPTTITAQSGAVIQQNTLVEPEGCPNTLTIISHTIKRRTITLKIAVPGPGKLTATASHLTKATKTTTGRATVTITLKAKGQDKLNTKIKLSFTPSKGRKLSAAIVARFRR